jgi:hypothetical protein
MQIISKYWLSAMFLPGLGMLCYAFYYDSTYGSYASWDVPPESMTEYARHVTTAERLYLLAWWLLGITAAGFLLRALIRLTGAARRTSPDSAEHV